MSRARLVAALALAKRKLAYRQGRVRRWHNSKLAKAHAKAEHWRKKREQAAQEVARLTRQLAKLDNRNPAHVAAEWILARVGRHEDPGRNNRAVWLDRWARKIGTWMVGQPWCGLTVWMAARAAGVTLTPETVSTVAIRRHAQAGTGGFKAWHPPTAKPKVGWVPVYGSSGPVHTGMVVSVQGDPALGEGNTSPEGGGGSQNDGGGIYIHHLSKRRGWLLGYAEIDWSKAKR